MILADTGFFLALANTQDRYHLAARALQKKYKEPLVTTWPVMTEACHLILYHLGVDSLLKFIKAISNGACQVRETSEHSLSQIHLLMKKFADLPMDLADASLVLLAGELDEGRIFSTDQRDFKVYRWKNTKPFQNLLALE